jgi:hypothetical protein
MRRARLETLSIENVVIGRLGVRDMVID